MSGNANNKNNHSFFASISDPIFEAIHEHGLTEGQADEFLSELVTAGHETILAGLKASVPQMLREDTELTSGFETRNYARWKEPFDLLRMLHRVCSEVGEAHAHEGPGEADILVFDTLARLHPRGLLIFNEILCLLKGGFADAALARWRTLHELSVVALFVKKHGNAAALGYRMNQVFVTERSVNQYNEYAERAGLEPISSEETEQFAERSAKAKTLLGRRPKGEWGWASEIIGKERVVFSDLEKDIKLDHWRPRVKWASQGLHAGFSEPMGTLGMSEAEQLVFQVGPSNSGMVDPIHMTAISMLQLSVAFLFFPEPQVERIILVKVIEAIVDEIGEAAVISNRRTRADSEYE